MAQKMTKKCQPLLESDSQMWGLVTQGRIAQNLLLRILVSGVNRSLIDSRSTHSAQQKPWVACVAHADFPQSWHFREKGNFLSSSKRNLRSVLLWGDRVLFQLTGRFLSIKPRFGSCLLLLERQQWDEKSGMVRGRTLQFASCRSLGQGLCKIVVEELHSRYKASKQYM